MEVAVACRHVAAGFEQRPEQRHRVGSAAHGGYQPAMLMMAEYLSDRFRDDVHI